MVSMSDDVVVQVGITAWTDLLARVEKLEGLLASRDVTEVRAKRKRGTRIPADYMPQQHTIDVIRGEFPGITDDHLIREHRKFCDYWNAKSGVQATKIDWEGTWRNWMRSAFEKMPGATNAAPRPQPSQVDQKVADLEAMREPE